MKTHLGSAMGHVLSSIGTLTKPVLLIAAVLLLPGIVLWAQGNITVSED